jgi:uncharacterized membrane protein YcaP (DUF421 family)
MEELFQTMLRTAVSYVILLIVIYLFGKRIKTHLNYHSFAISITIGSYIANMGFDINLKFWPTLASFLTLTFIFFLSSYLSYKQVNLRKFLAGQPLTIIEKGKMNEYNMQKAKYTIDDLQQQLREQGTFDIEEIETAILEVSGKLSIQPKPKYKPVVKQDVDPLYVKQAIELIIEGKILVENLTYMYNKEWIVNQCESRNVQVAQVSYAVVGTNDAFYIMT